MKSRHTVSKVRSEWWRVVVGVLIGVFLMLCGYWVMQRVLGISFEYLVLGLFQRENNLPYNNEGPNIGKPAIYLYPLASQMVKVAIDNPGGISTSYPRYIDGWLVTAHPEGKIEFQGRKYNYLFWEGPVTTEIKFDMSQGEVINGRETAAYLESKLDQLGLSETESNEFITYWLPKMEHNPYNLIHFATDEEYGQKVLMKIEPEPDSIIRVMMVYQPLMKPVTVKRQELPVFDRKGFVAVEWGGIELK